MDSQQLFRLPNASTCIAVLSASEVRYWRSESRKHEWELVAQFEAESVTNQATGTDSDRPGRSFDSVGKGRHAMAKEHDAREQAAIRFADSIATDLNRSILAGEFRFIVLFADPRMLGLLRDRLSAAAKQALVYQAPKNLANLDAPQIKEYFS